MDAKIAIKNYLDNRASSDALFAKNYAKEHKSIDECFRYIVGVARKKAVNNAACMTDEEVYGLAVHYYDEDDIKVGGKEVACSASHASEGMSTVPTVKTKPQKKIQGTQHKQLSLFDL